MARRKKEVKKRRKQQDESRPADTAGSGASPETDHPQAGPAAPEPETADPHAGEPGVEDSQIVGERHSRPGRRAAGKEAKAAAGAARAPAKGSWLGQNKENFLLGLLVLYVLLLGLGTVGELFEIEWILNLPLFR